VYKDHKGTKVTRVQKSVRYKSDYAIKCRQGRILSDATTSVINKQYRFSFIY